MRSEASVLTEASTPAYHNGIRLILRTKRRGDCHEYWRSAPDGVIRVLESKERQARPSLAVLEDALANLADRSEASLQRLRETRDLYAALTASFPAIVAQFKAGRAASVRLGAQSGED